MSELSYKLQLLKLKRIQELNNKLRKELARERITASNACLSLIDYTGTHLDYIIPDLWGYPQQGENPFTVGKMKAKGQDNDNGCCSIM